VQWGESDGRWGARSALEWPVDVFLGFLPVFMYGWERVWRCSGVVGCGMCVAVGSGATVGVDWGLGGCCGLDVYAWSGWMFLGVG
jgi:hypothetical protein